MYDLNELEAFVSVVKTGSLTASTRELSLPKSTLSRRIRNLENDVGQPLLRREARELLPNEAGRVFYQYSRDMLALAHEGQAALDELKEEVSGTMVLRCHESLVRGWFSRLVQSFMDGHPGLTVSVKTQREIPETVDDGVCIWLGSPGETSLRLEPLGQMTQGVYGSPEYFSRFGYPKTPGDLKHHCWVDVLGTVDTALSLHHPCHGTYPLSPPERAFTVDQFCVQGDVITKGRGLGLMPHWLAERRLAAHPDTFELCLPEWQGPVLPVSMLYAHGVLPRRVRAFIGHVRDSIPHSWWGSHVRAAPVPESGTHHATL